jgi:hypothetical protein
VFGLFGRKKRQEKMFSELMEAAQEGAMRKRLGVLAERYGKVSGEGAKFEEIAVEVAAVVVQKTMHKNGWQVGDLSQNQKFSVMMMMFVACDYISQKTHTEFEFLTLLVPVRLFGAEAPVQMGASLRAIGQDFNRMATDRRGAQILSSIGNCVSEWIGSESAEAIAKMSRMMSIMAEEVR